MNGRQLLDAVAKKAAESTVTQIVAAALAPSVVIAGLTWGVKYFSSGHSVPGWGIAAAFGGICALGALAIAQRRRIRALQPSGCVVLTPHQTNRPFWHKAKLASGQEALQARCEWYVRNIGPRPISIVGAFVGERAQWHGVVETFKSLQPGDLVRAIDPDETAEVSCDFWITPPPVSPGEPFVSTVVLLDDLNNRYAKRLRFDNDPNPARQLHSAMTDLERRQLVERKRRKDPRTPADGL